MKNAPERIIPKLPADIRIYWRFNELTQTGATGAPRKATRVKGDKILEDRLFVFENVTYLCKYYN
jgi:creatinine amidohydrolase